MRLNGNLCDTFEHMKKQVNKVEDADEVINMGWIRTMIASTNNQIPHIICGDKCGYVWVIDWDNLTIKNIFECHEDQIITLALSPTTDD